MTITADQSDPPPPEGTREAPPTEGLRERKKEQTRRALHRAALEIIVEHGPDGATIEEIAARAGVSRRTFFNYYPSRESVLTSSNPDANANLIAAIHDAPEGEPIPQLLRRAVLVWVNAAVTDTEMVRLRRRAIEVWPEYGLMVTAANTTVSRMVHEALVARPDTPDNLETAISLQLAMGVARAVYMDYARSGFTEDLPALMDRGFTQARNILNSF